MAQRASLLTGPFMVFAVVMRHRPHARSRAGAPLRAAAAGFLSAAMLWRSAAIRLMTRRGTASDRLLLAYRDRPVWP